MKQNNPYYGFYKLLKMTLFIMFLVQISSCITTPIQVSEISTYKEANHVFTEASRKDNTLNNSQPLPASVKEGFEKVISLLTLSDDKQKKLQKNNLWGRALVLKAMSYWRLERYAEAGEARNQALRKYSNQLNDWDRANLIMLPGLIHNDELYVKMKKKKGSVIPAEEALSIQQGFREAMKLIKKAKPQGAKHGEVRRFELISYLGAYRNMKESCQLNIKTRRICINKNRCEALQSYSELKKLLSQSQQNTKMLAMIRRNMLGGGTESSIQQALNKCTRR